MREQVRTDPIRSVDYNTAAHLVDYEGKFARRPFTYDELETLFDFPMIASMFSLGPGTKARSAELRDATDDQDGLRLRFTPPRAVLSRSRRPASELADAGLARSAPSTFATPNHVAAALPGVALCSPFRVRLVIDGLRQWVDHGRPPQPREPSRALADRASTARGDQDHG